MFRAVPLKQTIGIYNEANDLATNKRCWLGPRTGFPQGAAYKCFARAPHTT